MAATLKFGQDKSVDLKVKAESIVADVVAPQGTPLMDPALDVQSAFKDPLDYPALDQMVLPDDHVAIALEPGVPCAAELIAGTVCALTEIGVPPELIRIVRTPDDKAISDKKLLATVDAAISARLQIVRHDPAERENLSFLGASKEEHGVYINRSLCDAEVVIPISSLTKCDDMGCLGVHQGWYPAFADVETQQRFSKSLATCSSKKISKRSAECHEAAWMLGVQIVTMLVPAGHNKAMNVLVGQPDVVWRKANELSKQVWRMNIDRRASLVVVGIGGGPEQQTWNNVARAIDTALEVTEQDGAIVVCCQLSDKPGPAMRRLARAADYEAAALAIKRKPAADSLSAIRLNRALQRARVYLLSDLDEDVVEDLGLAYVSEPKEISKLSAMHNSCILLANAQHVSLSVDQKGE